MFNFFDINTFYIYIPTLENVLGVKTIFGLLLVFTISTTIDSKSIINVVLKTTLVLFMVFTFMLYLDLDTFACFLLVVEVSAMFFILILLNKYKYKFVDDKKTLEVLVKLFSAPIIIIFYNKTQVNSMFDTVYVNYYSNNFSSGNSDFFGVAITLFNSSIVFYGILFAITISTFFIVITSKNTISSSGYVKHCKDKSSYFFNKKLNLSNYSFIDEYYVNVKPSIRKWFKV